ncbi:MAG: hypothetical protein ABSG95_12550 [Solirubrobacteraceae bacterium]
MCEFHQLRARSGEARGPGPPELATVDLPYLGRYETYPLEIPGSDGSNVQRQLRVWRGPVLVLHQNCEIEYASQDDSRLTIAPVVSRVGWPAGPWELISAGELPGYMHLPGLPLEEAQELGLEREWPESAVALASMTASSRGIVKPNRILALAPHAIPQLQECLVRFSSVRGWGSIESAKPLIGARIVSVSETAETVPGPARLAKVVVQADDDVDEITVAWGLRRSGTPL